MRRSPFLTIGLGLAGLAALGLGVGLNIGAPGRSAQAETPPAATAVPVRLAEVVAEPGAGDVVATGKIKAVHERRLAFKIGGLIRSIKVDVGDRVTRGQVLAELDRKEIDSQSDQARVNLDKAHRDLDRALALEKAGYAPKQRVQDARTAVDVARAALDAVTFNRDLAHIVAAEDGVILGRSAEAGEIVAAGAPVLTLGDLTGNHLVRVGLSDRDVGRVAIGDVARIVLNAEPDRPLAARVTRIAAMSDPRTGTFDVEATLTETRPGLASGLIAEVTISPRGGATGPARVAAPMTALLEGHGIDANVFVYDPATKQARRRHVRVGPIRGGLIVITDGLALGDKVVTTGAAYLRDGDLVAPQADQTP